ncbi:helix-turn-helix domain-containing protein [Motilibacter deserti]|uniref:Helix-turn-helix transcriptional regulator n=1 Tax=Motilibacter deserti TaxID=2714956 RepID=A0ABX0GRX4_9ACTN|nr:helix-turn-helix transcriptional regulator [Motilibacter deserti]NHC13609.1 helix-turn-helix transcriptional regulator [Motilibacter deserti]
MIILRRLLGDVLRTRRQDQGRTLREVSAAARVSLGYLSEVERGQKEASSELLASICAALDVPMSEVLREVSDGLILAEAEAAVRDAALRETALPPRSALSTVIPPPEPAAGRAGGVSGVDGRVAVEVAA